MPASRVSAFLLGLCLAAAATVAAVFVGAAAGLTLSVSLPAAILSLALLTWTLKSGGAAEGTLVQTTVAAATSAATAAVFFAPAFLLSDLWKEIPFWTIALTVGGGGICGALYASHFRGVWAGDGHPFPESRACSHFLLLSTTKAPGRGPLLAGAGLGLLIKAGSAILGALRSSVEGAWAAGRTVVYLGAEVSPALLGIGFLAGVRIATALFIGSAVAWFVLLPIVGWDASPPPDALGWTWLTWNTQLRYLGIGALGVASLWSLFQSRRALWSGLRGIVSPAESGSGDFPRALRVGLLVLAFAALETAVWQETHSLSLATLGAITAFAFCLLASVASGTLAAVAGTSLMPVTALGLGILLSMGPWLKALAPSFALETLLLLVVFGSAVGGMVAGSLAQSLRIGEACGAEPKAVLRAGLLGVAAAACLIPFPLRYLHFAYGIGTGGRGALTPSQSNLFAGMAHGIAAGKTVPWYWIGLGLKIAVFLILVDEALRVRKTRFRLPIFAVALGMYVPLSVSLPVCIGGWLSWFAHGKKMETASAAAASGLVAGDAVVGVLISALVFANPQWVPLRLADSWPLGLGALVAVVVLLGALAGKKAEPLP